MPLSSSPKETNIAALKPRWYKSPRVRKISLGILLAMTGLLWEGKREHPEQHDPNAVTPHSREQLCELLKAKLGSDISIEFRHAKKDLGLETEVLVTEVAQTKEVLPPQPQSDFTARLFAVANRTTQASGDDVTSSKRWLTNYRLSKSQAACVEEKDMDCNDLANISAEELSYSLRLPIYLVSFWPKDSQETAEDSWHQVSAIKCSDGRFVIIENGKQVIFWDGTLEEYGNSYPARYPSWKPKSVVSLPGGISEYKRPMYDILPSKVLVQLWRSQTEEKMNALHLTDSEIAHK